VAIRLHPKGLFLRGTMPVVVGETRACGKGWEPSIKQSVRGSTWQKGTFDVEQERGRGTGGSRTDLKPTTTRLSLSSNATRGRRTRLVKHPQRG